MQNLEPLTDRQLMGEIVLGNHRAFTVLYRRYKHTLFYFIVKLSHGDYSMAEEIVQQVFVQLWENRSKIFIHQSVQNYLMVITRNLFLKETFRRVHDELMMVQFSKEQVESENSVDKEVELNLLLEEVERIISLLPPARQQVYRLKHLEHFSQKEISHQLGISENTVENHLKLSTKFIQQKLRLNHIESMNVLCLLVGVSVLLLL